MMSQQHFRQQALKYRDTIFLKDSREIFSYSIILKLFLWTFKLKRNNNYLEVIDLIFAKKRQNPLHPVAHTVLNIYDVGCLQSLSIAGRGEIVLLLSQ